MNDRAKWFRDARFGMFIHWGIYSIPARGEWIMYVNRIPVKEYEKLAPQFNPVGFNAEEWVALAKQAGMKYIIITAKHHDGFSMFKTAVDNYNIVDGTPFKRDPMAELAAACEKEGIKLCFYYSHVREWRHPHAQSLEPKRPDFFGNYGNFWDYPDEYNKNLQIYIDEFDKPQLKELLTQYGPIGIIWFDTPSLIRSDQAQELADIIRSIQPDCLINSRIGEGADWDYASLGDCEIPANGGDLLWETPMTICDAWGYNASENNRYRTPDEVIRQLVEIASLGGNYLLNVGPTSEGIIPREAQEILRDVGKWTDINGEAIYGTSASPFLAKPTWGRVTYKENRIYLHVFDWSETIKLNGIRGGVKQVFLPAMPEHAINHALDGEILTLSGLPETAPDTAVSVICLEFYGELDIDREIICDDAGDYKIPITLAEIHGSRITFDRGGSTSNWLNEDEWISFRVISAGSGDYRMQLVTRFDFNALGDLNHEMLLECCGQTNTAVLEDDGSKAYGYERRMFDVGTVHIGTAGVHEISVKASRITKKNGQGVVLCALNLIRI